ncbi:hypothetical protein Fmac_010126 [Flemingia macrophylla]|uniref:Fe2OG dioxygenase domain-containing protein n=1 Tax=Flemingia macrophylla TaxID=520843 RepID=A0ABD1N275_9FABA
MELLSSLNKDDIVDLVSLGFCTHCESLLHSRITSIHKRKLDETLSPDEGFGSSHGMKNGNVSNSESLTERHGKQWNSHSHSHSLSPRNSSQRRDSTMSIKGDEDDKQNFDSSTKYLVGCKQSDFDLLLNDGICEDYSFDNALSEEQRERIRYSRVHIKKDFTYIERVNGRHLNVLQGLELHTGVFNAVEQRKIVEWIYRLQWRGQQGKLRGRTYSEPRKWMRGKGRVTIQFGCCYSYAVDKNGNPPGILRDEEVDPLPAVFKQMIKRMIRWNIVPSTCIPDSCIVNIYEEGDCIPPHIDHHDFERPFYTVSFLNECNILFGPNLQVVGPGEFEGPVSILLPVGSVFILNGNGANVAKHCIPSVSLKRISITFRKMDESKLPIKFSPDPELERIKPLKELKGHDEVENLDFQQNKVYSVESESNIVWNTRKALFHAKNDIALRNNGRFRKMQVNRFGRRHKY